MMNPRRLIFREILHRKLQFTLGLIAVLLPVAAVTAMLHLLKLHDVRTEEVLAGAESQARARQNDIQTRVETEVRVMEDEIRRDMKNLGFNIIILPKDQNLTDFHNDDFATRTMPEEYARKLSEARELITINHLLPTLTRKVTWPEYGRQIMLVGTRGQVHISHREPGKPIRYPVEPGKIELGHQLATDLNLKAGQTVKLMGREFAVSKVQARKGNKDDIAAWVELTAAQEMLKQEGRINAILALECNCASLDRLAEIDAEIRKILGDQAVQVVELQTIATVRAKQRVQAQERGKRLIQQAEADGAAAIEAARINRGDLRNQRETFAAGALPVLAILCCVWLGLLSLANVRQRRNEIGLMRALGLRAGQVLGIFLGRAGILAVAGAILGYPLGIMMGFTTGRWLDESHASISQFLSLADPWAPVVILGCTVAIAMIACWLPSLAASRQDPAVALREE